jgi:hypothetical protein
MSNREYICGVAREWRTEQVRASDVKSFVCVTYCNNALVNARPHAESQPPTPLTSLMISFRISIGRSSKCRDRFGIPDGDLPPWRQSEDMRSLSDDAGAICLMPELQSGKAVGGFCESLLAAICSSYSAEAVLALERSSSSDAEPRSELILESAERPDSTILGAEDIAGYIHAVNGRERSITRAGKSRNSVLELSKLTANGNGNGMAMEDEVKEDPIIDREATSKHCPTEPVWQSSREQKSRDGGRGWGKLEENGEWSWDDEKLSRAKSLDPNHTLPKYSIYLYLAIPLTILFLASLLPMQNLTYSPHKSLEARRRCRRRH